MLLPAWLAWIEQVPAFFSSIVVPSTLHTDCVCEVKVTLKPEEAVALTVTGDCANDLLARAPKAMV